MKRPLYRIIASLREAIANCRKSGNQEWEYKHELHLKKAIDLIPLGVELMETSHKDKFYLTFTYPIYNDVGYHIRTEDYRVRVTPSWDGIDLRIFGWDNWADYKDYFYDTLHHALSAEYTNEELYNE